MELNKKTTIAAIIAVIAAAAGALCFALMKSTDDYVPSPGAGPGAEAAIKAAKARSRATGLPQPIGSFSPPSGPPGPSH